MYAAVYYAGPRWSDTVRHNISVLAKDDLYRYGTENVRHLISEDEGGEEGESELSEGQKREWANEIFGEFSENIWDDSSISEIETLVDDVSRDFPGYKLQ